jgi:hypothetical protein
MLWTGLPRDQKPGYLHVRPPPTGRQIGFVPEKARSVPNSRTKSQRSPFSLL